MKRKKQGMILAVCGLLFVGLALVFGAMRPFVSQVDGIREKVLRLHVVANSNETSDQKLKLVARDAILEEARELFASALDAKEAKKIALNEKDRLEAAAKGALEAAGCSDEVEILVTEMFFSKRIYEDGTTLPAGNYQAVRVVIGSGEGKNWWCLLFPKICLSATSKEENKTALGSVLNETQCDILTNSEKYQVRLFLYDAAMELYHRLFGEEK